MIDKHLQNLAISSIAPSLPIKSFQDFNVDNPRNDIDSMKRNLVNFNPNLKNIKQNSIDSDGL